MEQALHTLRTFSAKKQARYLYLSRLDAQREHLTILHEHDMMEQELQQAKSAQELAQAERDQAIERELRAQAEREQAQAEREQALAELAELKKRLKL